MTTLATVVVASMVAWMSLLTVACLVWIRQMTLLGLRVDRASTLPGQDLEDLGPVADYRDGLPPGSAMPEGAHDILARVDRRSPHLLLTLSGTCAPCRELAPQIKEWRPPVPFTLVLPGRAVLATEMLELSGANPGDVLLGETAERLTALLEITSTPSATLVYEDHVVGTRYLHGLQDVHALMQSVDQQDDRSLQEGQTHVEHFA